LSCCIRKRRCLSCEEGRPDWANFSLLGDCLRWARFCQIFHGETCQNGGKYTKWLQTIPNSHKLFQIAIKYTKLLLNIPNWH
jgi:hypothetical protein